MRTTILAALLASVAAMPAAADWRTEFPTIRWGMSASESEEERRARYGPATDYLSGALGVDVDVRVTADVAGVVEALLSRQIEMFYFGPLGYATAWDVTDGNLVPMVSNLDSFGDWGYRGTIIVATDSDIQTLEDLEGRSFAFSDPGSTSGYLIPQFLFREMGITPDSFFSEVAFSGGNNNSVFGVVNGTFDSAASWEQTPERSVPGRMVERGLIEPDSTRVIWYSDIIPGAVIGARADLPAEMIEDIRAVMEALPTDSPEALAAMSDGQASGMRTVTHADYETIVEMRRLDQQMRRGE